MDINDLFIGINAFLMFLHKLKTKIILLGLNLRQRFKKLKDYFFLVLKILIAMLIKLKGKFIIIIYFQEWK